MPSEAPEYTVGLANCFPRTPRPGHGQDRGVEPMSYTASGSEAHGGADVGPVGSANGCRHRDEGRLPDRARRAGDICPRPRHGVAGHPADWLGINGGVKRATAIRHLQEIAEEASRGLRLRD